MSQRIQAGDVLNEAFQFGYRRWLTVFRFLWMPFLVAGLFGFAALNFMFDTNALNALGDNPSIGDLRATMKISLSVAALIAAAGIALMLFLYSGVYASIFRLVALGEERPGPFQFRFDGPAQRVFWAQLIMTAINYGVVLLAGAVALAVSGQSVASVMSALGEFAAIVAAASAEGASQPDPGAIKHLAAPLSVIFQAFVFALPLIIYLNVKLAPFLPGSAAENRLLLFGAFRMTSGHAWSVFLVFVMFFMVMVIISVIYSIAIGVVDMMAGLRGGGLLALISGLFSVISFFATVVYQVFMMGVQMSLMAIIYRRLKTGE